MPKRPSRNQKGKTTEASLAAAARESHKHAQIAIERARRSDAALKGWLTRRNNAMLRALDVFTTVGTEHLTLKLSESSRAGKFMSQVEKAIYKQDPRYVASFKGKGVTDIYGVFHAFETDLDKLYELDAEAGSPFDIHYEILPL
jgi:hypothetical protein